MIVTNEPRRAERAELASDPVPYAYAPTSVTSFVKVLHEITTQEASRTDAPSDTDRTESASETQANESSKPGDDVEAEPGATETAEATANSSNETSETAPGDGGDENAEATAPERTPQDSTALDLPDTATPSPEGAPDTGEDTNTAAQLPTAVSAATDTEQVSSTAAASKPTSNLTQVAADAESQAPDATVTSDGADLEEGTAPATFPKTLNALLAENALRQREPDTAPLASKASMADIAPDLAQEPPAVEEPPPPTSPVPRSASMELGGVRPEAATVPRVPLTNLPGELAQQIHLMQQEGNRTMRIRLVPENLGELKIEIQGTGDTMRVRMIAATPAARDALESQMGDLRQALQKQGLSLDQFSVDSGQEHRDPREQFEPPRRRTGHDDSTLVAADVSEPVRTNPASVALDSSALNIFA